MRSVSLSLLAATVLLLHLGMARADAPMPEFRLPDITGQSHALSDMRGKWVVVNFWATWCPPCREEIPELIQFHDRHYRKDAVVWGVNLEKIDQAKLAGFVDEQMISYPVMNMGPTRNTPVGPIPGLPTTYLVAPDGRVVARTVGTVTSEMLEKYMARWEAERK